MPSAILNEIHEKEGMVIVPLVEEQPPQINHPVLFIRASLFLQDLCARGVAALHGLAAILGRLLPEDGVVLPQPALNYIITYLLAFVAIKSQGHPDFRYITHHKSVLAAVICVIMFGFASVAEHIATRVDQPPVLKGVARTGRILCLFLFVIILTYLSCF